MTQTLYCPNSTLEFWFRKAPASFDEMITSHERYRFWLATPNVASGEFGDDYPSMLTRAFYAFHKHIWACDDVSRRLDHSDMLIIRGKRLLGAVLINQWTTLMPLAWRNQAPILIGDLRILPLGLIR